MIKQQFTNAIHRGLTYIRDKVVNTFSALAGSLPFTCRFLSLVECLIRLYGHSEYYPMRASFSSWCDKYYNLRILLIGE